MTVRLRPGTPLAARGGLAAAQAWDAAGDVLVATGPDRAAPLTVGTEGGAAFCADPNATNKVSWSAPQTVDLRSRGATGSLASTCDRATAVETNLSSVVSSGRLALTRILLPKGLLVTSITWWSMTTALSAGTNQWFGLFDSSRNILRLTGDDTSTAWAANSAKTLNLSSTFTTTYAGWHYVGIMVKGTVPSLAGASATGTGNIRAAAPIPTGSSTGSLTDPASCPNPAGAITVLANIPYAEVS